MRAHGAAEQCLDGWLVFELAVLFFASLGLWRASWLCSRFVSRSCRRRWAPPTTRRGTPRDRALAAGRVLFVAH